MAGPNTVRQSAHFAENVKADSSDQLGVVTRAYFAQRYGMDSGVGRGLIDSDFTQTDIIEDFYGSLVNTLEEKSGENAIYMGKHSMSCGTLS